MTAPLDARSPMRKLRDCLQDLHFLHRLKLEALEELLTVMKKRKYKQGETIFKQGDEGDSFYMVSEGKLSYLTRKGLKTVKVADLYTGDYFGEGALINEGSRASTVIADTDCELYILHKDDFNKTLMANPEIAVAIKTHMATRAMSRAQTKGPNT